MLVCSYFGDSRNVQQTIKSASHGGGHEFESRRVHFLFLFICRGNVVPQGNLLLTLSLFDDSLTSLAVGSVTSEQVLDGHRQRSSPLCLLGLHFSPLTSL
jgi:hypothetical protein